MKLSFFAAILACILGTSLAIGNPKVAQVHSAVMSYVNDNMASIRMMRGSSAHLECYDNFTELINEVASKAKEISSECVGAADSTKGNESDSLKASRSDLSTDVQRIQDSLAACGESSDDIGYFECLIGLVDEDKKILDNIGSRASALIDRYAEVIQGIEFDEQTCHRKTVDDAKVQTDKAFESLRNCMTLDRLTTTTTTESPPSTEWDYYTRW